jgi:hypothetical protein
MWQKCWNTNQSLVHNLRFRERGPLKSWRPETMAEAIFSVLKEGLSLSQAARWVFNNRALRLDCWFSGTGAFDDTKIK